MEAGIKPLNKLVEEAIKNHESELKTHKRDELAYQARVEGLHADLKSASKTTARKKAEHTANEFVDLIMEAEDNAPPPPVMRRYYTNDATIEKFRSYVVIHHNLSTNFLPLNTAYAKTGHDNAASYRHLHYHPR